jgi:hypothetical protein
MAQILQPLHTAVGSLSDSINSFFGLGDAAPPATRPAFAHSVAAIEIETDPHFFSSARWIQEIER